MRLRKTRKSEILTARCEPQLRSLVDTLARAQRRDPSDIVRLACEEYVLRFQVAPAVQSGAVSCP